MSKECGYKHDKRFGGPKVDPKLVDNLSRSRILAHVF